MVHLASEAVSAPIGQAASEDASPEAILDCMVEHFYASNPGLEKAIQTDILFFGAVTLDTQILIDEAMAKFAQLPPDFSDVETSAVPR